MKLKLLLIFCLIFFERSIFADRHFHTYQPLTNTQNREVFEKGIDKFQQEITCAAKYRDYQELVNILFDLRDYLEKYTSGIYDLSDAFEKLNEKMKKDYPQYKVSIIDSIKRKLMYKEKQIYNIANKCAKRSLSSSNSLPSGLTLKCQCGIMISLCGCFLSFVPIPICQQVGKACILTGTTMAGDEIFERMNER